ncbi:MAG: tail fiber protein [Gammaproteobacteria bacterium]|nr:tail fiber protein [Gammaproteobacteria bacterium]
MSEPFLAEIRMFGFDFPPRGWAFCDGQILPINQNQSLFSLLGTTYGGDGRTSFALPDLRGRTPIHVGSGFNLGLRSGQDQVVLSFQEIPNHTHTLNVSTANAAANTPTGNLYARSATPLYHARSSTVNMRTDTVANSGGGQGHENMQPFLAVRFCIAIQGLFPSRN